MARRPVIGITAMVERAAWTVWADVEVNVSQRTYSRGVSEAGGLPFLLPADEASAESPDQLLDLLDGLVLAGGSDIDPASYGAPAAAQTKGARIERDRFELALCHGALARGMPVLGVCRGMQLLNVACGGTLEQHLPDAPSATCIRRGASPTTTSGWPRGRGPRGRSAPNASPCARTTIRAWPGSGKD